MELPPEILQHLSCPQCVGSLRYTKEKVLFCIACRLCFPIEDGIPHLSLEVAMPLTAEGKVSYKNPIASFKIEAGADTGQAFQLEKGACKAIGRRMDDVTDTKIVSPDLTMALDDHSQKLIHNYLARSSGKKKVSNDDPQPSQIGGFKRLSDLVLGDTGVSRLHAMIFYDANGVGILDLVSRNGTFINGREVEASLLKDGDLLQIGSSKIRFNLITAA